MLMFVFQGDKSTDVLCVKVIRVLMFVYQGDKSADVLCVRVMSADVCVSG